MYFCIADKTDTAIVVKTVVSGYDFDWKTGADSLYNLGFKQK